MVVERSGAVATRRKFRRNDISVARDQFVERLVSNEVASEFVVQQNVRAAIDECKDIAAVYYCTRDGEKRVINCQSRSREEVSFLVKGLDTNASKRARRNARHCHTSYPTLSSNGAEPERRHSSRRLLDVRDAFSSNSSDSKRKRSERDNSASPSFKERRRMSRSIRDEIAISNNSPGLNLNVNPVHTAGQLRIGDEDAVHEFFVRRFKDLQQNLCKAIAKPWIKMINPNKQTKNPYAGGTDSSPWWWPNPPPPGIVPSLKNGFVRHKEPDHLKMQERLILLPRILELVINPPANDERADEIRKINLKEFQRMTYEQLSDKLNESNRDKKRFLDEIFAAAFQMQRYKRGLIDAGCRFVVSNYNYTRHNKKPEDYHCNTKPDDGEEGISQGTSFSTPCMHHPPAPPSPSDRQQHNLPDPKFNLDDGRTPLAVRDPRVPLFQPQAATNELSYGPDYNISLGANEGPYPGRTLGTYSQTHAPQEPQRRYQVIPQWYLGTNQYHSNTPMISNLMDNPPGPCQSFSSTPSFPLPQVGSFLPSLSLPAICLPQEEVFSEGTEVPRLCEVSQPLGKEGIGERGETVRLPYRPHGFQDYLPSPTFGSNVKQVCEEN